MKHTEINFLLIAFFLFFSAGCGDAAPETPASDSPVAQINASAARVTEITTTASATIEEPAAFKMPRIIDFGSKQCKACKAMEPVLESLAANHADKFKTEFVDVWVPENQTFAKSYEISSIPTQVFLNAEGKEVYRNTGFISEEDVVAKFTELGLISAANGTPEASSASETAKTDAPAEPTAPKEATGE